MAKVIKVEGLADLLEVLQTELPKATHPNVVKRSLLEAAEPMRREAETLAPHLTGTLQSRIFASPKLTERQRKTHEKKSKVEVFVGAGPLVQAITQEFGTVNFPPQPFLRPAWDSNKRGALDILRDKFKEQIDKSIARAQRKAARLAAKMK
jgi:HK97 gp10 family phage protein